jgi:hypothetical protein
MNASLPTHILAPVGISKSFYGVVFEYVSTDRQLVEAGIVQAAELPGPRRGSFARTGNVTTSRLADGRCRAKVCGHRASRVDGGFRFFLDDLVRATVPTQKEQGAVAFRKALMDLKALAQQFANDSGDYDPTRFMPALQQAFKAGQSEEWAAGFWDAFGVWLSQTLEGCDIDLERWDVLRDLENEEGTP